MKTLSIIEKTSLVDLEVIIERGMGSFVEVGNALLKIRDSRLYRESHGTFEAYCQGRWGMARNYANKLISGAQTVGNLGTNVPKPLTETQARPLTSLPPEKQAEVWQVAVDTAPDGRVTERHVEAAVKDFKEKHPPKESTPSDKGKFNEPPESIEWARWSWNPVTGCKQGCKYCYAREIANRFDGHFRPTFHENRLTMPINTKLPTNPTIRDRNVFVCSMADLFGEWVSDKWIEKVLNVCREQSQWTYLFLTKNPKRYTTIDFPPNAWVGTTIDTQARVKPAEDAFRKVKATIKFVSLEPLLEEVTFPNPSLFDWYIIGGQSQTSKSPAFQPEWRWVETILSQARSAGKMVYFKPNLTIKPKEYPR